ncbi:MAG: PilZ domain-containing protein [Terriglobia bacterium]
MLETQPHNRRRAERRQTSKSIALVVDSERSAIASHAFAVDLSQLGARIRTRARLQLGQQVTVIPREGRAFAVPSRVVWVNAPESESEPEAGLAFLEPQELSSSLLAEAP